MRRTLVRLVPTLMAGFGIVLAGGLVAAAAGSHSLSGRWQTAKELPGIGSLNKNGFARVNALSCGSAGNCAAGGSYSLAGGREQAFVADQKAGTWHAAISVPGLAALNKGGFAEVDALSCGSAGNCGAGGIYLDARHHYQAFVVTEHRGRWGKARTAPGTAALNKGGVADIQSMSCTRTGFCAAGGYYRDAASHRQAFLIEERNGVWRAAKEVPGTSALNQGADAQLTSISCTAAGTCSAGGEYTDSGGSGQAFVISETNGAWHAAIEVPGLGALNSGGFVGLASISCASPGNCAAGGEFHRSPTDLEAYVVTETKGHWGSAEQVPGTALLNAGGDAGTSAVSCAAPGNCSAVGSYLTNLGKTWPFVLTEKNGHWGKATLAPGVTKLSVRGFGEFFDLSCASPGNCAAVGEFVDAADHDEALVISQRNGAWGPAIEVPGTQKLNKGNSFGTVVSCRAPGACSGAGFYHDSHSKQEVFVFTSR